MAAAADGFTLVGRRGRAGGPAMGGARAPPASPVGTPVLDSQGAACALPDAASHHPGLRYVAPGGGSGDAGGGNGDGTGAGRRRRDRRHGSAVAPPSPSPDDLLLRLRGAVARLEGTAVAACLRDCVGEFLRGSAAVAAGNDDNDAAAPVGGREVDVVCYGLGSLRYGANPLLQLAALRVLADAAAAAQPPSPAPPLREGRALQPAVLPPGGRGYRVSTWAYDPLFDDVDRAVLAAEGVCVLPTSDGGRRGARRVDGGAVPTIFFMPHCGEALNAAVLGALWVGGSGGCGGGGSESGAPPAQRWHAAYVGNSLSWYWRSWGGGEGGAQAPVPWPPRRGGGSAARRQAAEAEDALPNPPAPTLPSPLHDGDGGEPVATALERACMRAAAAHAAPSVAARVDAECSAPPACPACVTAALARGGASVTAPPTACALARVRERLLLPPAGVPGWDELGRALDATAWHAFEWR